MKYKKLSKNQILISIDRLTRFKPVEEKYRRVFNDIIFSNLIEPKYKKSDLEKMSNSDLRDIAVQIFNSSFPKNSKDTSINEKIKEYENNIYINEQSAQEFLDNEMDYKSAIDLISDDTDVLNLKWLKILSTDKNQINERKKNGLLYPIEKVVIAEGITEEILLPVFSDFCGYNFNQNGVKVLAAGGKNQVVKLYYKLAEELKIPIFVLLDKDAESNEYSINTKLRTQDKVYLLDSGEFEDLLPKNLIVKTVNNEFKNFIKISKSDLNTGMSMVKTLEELFKERCLHEFKKADFAQRVKSQVKYKSDISDEVKNIILKIKTL